MASFNSDPASYFRKYEIWLSKAHPKVKDWLDKEIEYLKENIRPNSKILDVGCGFGRHIEFLADFSREVIGIDINENMIQYARKRFSNLENIKFFVQDAQRLEFADESFDYVICMTNTFGNMPDIKSNVLKEMKRVCKKNGNIIISVYSDNTSEIRKKDYEKAGLHIIKVKDELVYTEEDLISEGFTKPQLKRLFDEEKLESKIIELNEISFLCELTR